jgi:hypothetical protein
MKTGFLKKSLTRYLIVGVLAGFMCFACLLLYQYKKSLEDSLRSFSNITIKTVKMKNTIAEMNHSIASLHALYPYSDLQTSKDALLRAVDETKSILRGGDITLRDMTRQEGELILPVEIKIDNTRYADIIACIGYLQSRIIPYTTIEMMDVQEDNKERTGQRMFCTMEIFFRMPDDGKDI